MGSGTGVGEKKYDKVLDFQGLKIYCNESVN